MKIWYTLIDFSLPLIMVYLVIKKGSLSIVYVPFIYFMYNTLEKSKIIAGYHLLFALLLFYYVIFNLPFLKRNFFYLILILFFTYQLRLLDDFQSERLRIIGYYWAFTIIILAPEICKNYTSEKILNELSLAGSLILGFFVANSVLATFLGYYPENHYGFNSGISFGHLGISHYNILPLAIFVVLRRGVLKKEPLFLFLAVIGLFLTFLTLRRVAMVLSIVAFFLVMMEVLNFKQIKQFAFNALIVLLVGIIVLKFTGFADQLFERMEQRNLDDRELQGEGRLLELSLVYKDIFVYFDYDPWFGNGPFKSSGNYGKKVFGYRPLHTDIALFVHGLGFFGLFLYILTVSLAFYQAWQNCRSKKDKIMYLFVLIYFMLYFLVGSPRNPMSPIILYMLLGSVFGKMQNIDEVKTIKV